MAVCPPFAHKHFRWVGRSLTWGIFEIQPKIKFLTQIGVQLSQTQEIVNELIIGYVKFLEAGGG